MGSTCVCISTWGQKSSFLSRQRTFRKRGSWCIECPEVRLDMRRRYLRQEELVSFLDLDLHFMSSMPESFVLAQASWIRHCVVCDRKSWCSCLCPVPNFKMASMISDRVVKCSMIYLYIFQRQMFAYAQLQVFPPLNIGFLLSHNLDLVPVDLNPTVRRAHVKIVRRCSSHVLSPVANPETQKAYWESQGLHAIWCHLRLHTRIWD